MSNAFNKRLNKTSTAQAYSDDLYIALRPKVHQDQFQCYLKNDLRKHVLEKKIMYPLNLILFKAIKCAFEGGSQIESKTLEDGGEANLILLLIIRTSRYH